MRYEQPDISHGRYRGGLGFEPEVTFREGQEKKDKHEKNNNTNRSNNNAGRPERVR
jgi:hypothetical protein